MAVNMPDLARYTPAGPREAIRSNLFGEYAYRAIMAMGWDPKIGPIWQSIDEFKMNLSAPSGPSMAVGKWRRKICHERGMPKHS
jgi:hypothetical protein